MARLPAVLDALHKLGHDRRTWSIFALKLREAGLLPASKRGVGATEFDAEKIAKILLAGMATDSPARGPERVRQLWDIPLLAKPDQMPETLASVVNRSLGAALTGLIEDAAKVAIEIALAPISDERLAHIERTTPPPGLLAALRSEGQPVYLRFTIDRTLPSGRLEFSDARPGDEIVEGEFVPGEVLWASQENGSVPKWVSSITITEAALLALSDLVPAA